MTSLNFSQSLVLYLHLVFKVFACMSPLIIFLEHTVTRDHATAL